MDTDLHNRFRRFGSDIDGYWIKSGGVESLNGITTDVENAVLALSTFQSKPDVL